MPGLPVLSAEHGEGYWDPFIIANSLENFSHIIFALAAIAVDRADPVALENNPVPAKESKAILKKIEKENADIEIWYWENFFEND